MVITQPLLLDCQIQRFGTLTTASFTLILSTNLPTCHSDYLPMRYKVQPEDFIVEERIRLPLVPRGRFAIYRVRKRGVTTLSVQARMARALNVPHSDVIFPALKDKDAVAVQHAAVRGAGPARLTGNGFEAEFLGRSSRPLGPAGIVANCFTIVLRDLSGEEAAHIQERLARIAQFGLPNYFDQQRFGSLAPGHDHIGKLILQRDAEGALRAYLTQPFVGDPAPTREFKTFAAGHWGDWDVLFEAAPRPSNYRSVLTYLRDHPHPAGGSAERTLHYRKALNLIARRLLSIYLAAYQSLLWNRIAARYLAAWLASHHDDYNSSVVATSVALSTPTTTKVVTTTTGRRNLAYVEIAGERLPVHQGSPSHFDRDLDSVIPLPNHRAVYADPDLSAVVAQVLAEEGLTLNDLKARILKKAYLSKGKRALLLFPQDTSASPPEPDDRFPGRSKLTLSFTLPRGSYATLVVKAAAA
jgi:tRNA pseudouridine13 synthase